MKKVGNSFGNSLVIVGVLGALLLLFSNFVKGNLYLLMFSQITSTVSVSFMFVIIFYVILKKEDRSLAYVLLFIGSGGLVFNNISEIMLDNFSEKSNLVNMAEILISLGVINLINSKFKKDEQSV